MVQPLNLERLRRIQATLQRRIAVRDPGNIHAIGFAPRDMVPLELEPIDNSTAPLPCPVFAQIDVNRKLSRVADPKRVPKQTEVRVLDRGEREYDAFGLTTKVVQTNQIKPTAVAIRTGRRVADKQTGTQTGTSPRATVATVVRWTTDDSATTPSDADPHDPRWRWGTLTVSHLFSGGQTSATNSSSDATIDRVAACGDGPATIPGNVRARGRIPGGPDLALVETGLDRIWLSGFLARPGDPPLEPADERQLLRWTQTGTTGEFYSHHPRRVRGNHLNQNSEAVVHRWRWLTYYPRWSIPQLGNLEQVIRYEIVDHNPVKTKPFGPGTSGSLLVSSGLLIGLHIAAEGPDYRIGYAQTFNASLAWLRQRLATNRLAMISIVD